MTTFMNLNIIKYSTVLLNRIVTECQKRLLTEKVSNNFPLCHNLFAKKLTEYT